MSIILINTIKCCSPTHHHTRDRVSLCSPGCPGTHFVDQAGLELRNPPASDSQVLGLKTCATTTWQNAAFFMSAKT
ncbi:mCG148039 [Mus musculus]|nr:mCG148039 [Mus musculus]